MMNLAWIGFGCAGAGAVVITLYTIANYQLRRNGTEAVWLGGWILGTVGMSLTGVGWAVLAAAGPHYNITGLRYAGFGLAGLGGLLYLLGAVHVGRLRSREHYTLELHTSGIYKLVRHPQALALCLVAVGVGLATQSRPFLWGLPLWVGYWIAYTVFEERFELIPAYGRLYLRYRENTARLFPSLKTWKAVTAEIVRFSRVRLYQFKQRVELNMKPLP